MLLVMAVTVQLLTSQVLLLVREVAEVVVLVQDMVLHMIKVQQVQEAVVLQRHQVMDQVMLAQQIKVVAVVPVVHQVFVVVVLTQAALGVQA